MFGVSATGVSSNQASLYGQQISTENQQNQYLSEQRA